MEKESSKTDVKEATQTETKALSTKARSTKSSKICLHYFNSEYCKYGNNCKFSHNRRKIDKNLGIKNLQRNSNIKKDAHDKKLNPMSKNFTVFTREGNANDSGESHLNVDTSRPCRYFKAGTCRNAERCHFSHLSESNTYVPFDSSVPSQFIEKVKSISTASNYKKKSIPLCRYFRRGFCQNGDKCKYYHQKGAKENLNLSPKTDLNQSLNNMDCMIQHKHMNHKENFNQEKYVNASNTVKLPQCTVDSNNKSDLREAGKLFSDNSVSHNSRNIFELSSEKTTLQLRNTEIIQFKKRFPTHEVLEENISFSCVFEPSDPDWPFDLRSMKLEVTFPEKYPVEVCTISVHQNINYMPEILIRHLNKSISDWLTRRHETCFKSKQVELLFRPFLKWFDKNVETLFDSGLKRVKQDIDARNSGIEFVPVESLFPSRGDSNASDDPPTSKDCELSAENAASELPPDNEENSVPCSNQKVDQNMSQNIGTKVLLIGLELVEGAAALSCTKFSGMLQCGRCKMSCNVKSVPNKNNCMVCVKCSKAIEYNFTPSIMHQFSNVLGTIYLVECQIGDVNLVECTFLVDCLSCSKQVAVDGIHYGQKQKLWCKFCNQKLIIGIEGVKFQASSPTFSVAKPTVIKKIEKKKGDMLIKEGGPLPEFGTCKHYKKSNRWLRFPCCGRIYPCDICHEDKESDHEMKFATRMICGFCSKEQPYTKDKPCTGCSGNVVAKSGAHWEGGKGCRNKVKMSRNDIHKYVGTCKTISKKSQSSGNKNKK